jgi:hypothetical protein
MINYPGNRTTADAKLSPEGRLPGFRVSARYEWLGAFGGRISPNVATGELTDLTCRSAPDLVRWARAGTGAEAPRAWRGHLSQGSQMWLPCYTAGHAPMGRVHFR